MSKIGSRSESIRKFILDNIEQHSNDIGKLAAGHFNISRQAINKHLQRLVNEAALIETGKTQNKAYKLAAQMEWGEAYEVNKELAEDVVWRRDIKSRLGSLSDNLDDIWHYGFTEMFNNAIDHSGGSKIVVHVVKTAINTEITIQDNGVGIFKKIQSALNLLDERHAVLELAKGKLTTDPKHHSGEGIFFASRMFDSYCISSGEVYFAHDFDEAEDWIFEQNGVNSGTIVRMKLNNHTSRTTKKIFDNYAPGDEFAFNKTVVPVQLAQYGNDKLISRSQAKRLLARVELFKVVLLDFSGVESIGQAFADEIFRVFANQHPNIEMPTVHANDDVSKMIQRAKNNTL